MGDGVNAVQVQDLTVAYHSKPVIRDVCMEIPKGKLAALVGPNGAGKTTLIKAMLGLLKPVAGTVKIHALEEKCKGSMGCAVGYVPQSESVDWDFPATVLDIVMMGRYGALGWFKRPGKKEKTMAMEILERVGMGEFSKRQISQLSGGQQQRVFLARALVQEAEVYFMDEPFKGVDVQTEKSIVTLLKDLKAEGKTVVVVHHDLNTVRDYFDWVTIINGGIVANGSVAEVFHEENLQKAYGSPVTFLRGGV